MYMKTGLFLVFLGVVGNMRERVEEAREGLKL
jgi:hypothetical protein